MVITDEIVSTIKDLHSLNGTFFKQQNIRKYAQRWRYNFSQEVNLIYCLKIIHWNCVKTKKKKEIIANDEIQYPIFSLSPRLRHKMPSEIMKIQEPPNIEICQWLIGCHFCLCL